MTRAKILNNCKFCGDEYFGFGLIYCSRSCRAKDTGVGNGIKTGTFVLCSVCKNKVWRSGSLIKKFKHFFCTKKCLGHSNGERLKGTERNNYWMIGEKNKSWKGGVTPINMKIRKSKEMSLWKRKVLERDKFTCKLCGQIGGKLHVDHIKPFATYPNLRFSLKNGRTLCLECHKSTESYGWSGYWLNKKLKNI